MREGGKGSMAPSPGGSALGKSRMTINVLGQQLIVLIQLL